MKTIEEHFEDWQQDVDAINRALKDGIGHEWARIDEVAVMLPSALDAFKWISESVKVDGVKLFNHAEDSVRTYPLLTEYDVNYWFLETDRGYRVEVMSLAGGHSPLHEAIKPKWQKRREKDTIFPVTVHYSFKCPDVASYGRVVDWFKAAEWAHVQSCVSTYGQFSYWMVGEADDPMGDLMQRFVKPRANTRDTDGASTLDGYLSKKAGS